MEIAEYDSQGRLLRRFVPGPRTDMRAAMIEYDPVTGVEVARYGYLTNRLGSVVAVVDAAGTVTDKYIYTPFGVEAPLDASGNPFRYTGRKLDPETGLYYYRARYYDPDQGRFLETDPVFYEDQMNLYAYVGNDPVNATDPTGEATVTLKANLSGFLGGGKGGTVGVIFGTKRDGGSGVRLFGTNSGGVGLGIDASVGGGFCPGCDIEDHNGQSATSSAKAVGGIEISMPITDDLGDDVSKTSISASVGLSAEFTLTKDVTYVEGMNHSFDEGSNNQSAEDVRNDPEINWPIED